MIVNTKFDNFSNKKENKLAEIANKRLEQSKVIAILHVHLNKDKKIE